ncbi:MAG: NADH-quinone oxidoreductase subunit J [Cyclobacteriaceae bacterium]
MNLTEVALYAFEILAGAAALAILFVRNVFHAALLLIVCLTSLAGVFVIYNAEFIAVTQILVYAGGVLVLIIFGVMLSSRITGKPLLVSNQYLLPASLIGILSAMIFIKLFMQQHFYQHPGAIPGNRISQTGITLMSDYVLPFEIAGILLLIALLGAAVIASSFNPKSNNGK